VLRWVALALFVLFVALQVHLWAGRGGLRELWRLEQRVEDQKAANAKLKARNDRLSAEVEDLKHGEEAVEERARAELGLIKPGETFYQVVEPETAGSRGAEHRDE